MKINKNRQNFRGGKVRDRGQSILEYVIIVGVVAAAVMAMQVYFRRAVNARLEEIKQEYVPKPIPAAAPGSTPPIIGTPPSGPPDPIIGTPPSGPPGAQPVK